MITGAGGARRAAPSRSATPSTSPTSTRAATRSTPTSTVYEEITGGNDEHEGRRPRGERPGLRRRASTSRAPTSRSRSGLLSGGERNRVHLAKMLKAGGNVLLLDEPTNDLDVDTLRALEDALEAFAGCAVVISHDRWFLDRIATHILAFEGDSQVRWFEGNFTRVRGVAAQGARRRGRPAPPHQVQAAAPLGLRAHPCFHGPVMAKVMPGLCRFANSQFPFFGSKVAPAHSLPFEQVLGEREDRAAGREAVQELLARRRPRTARGRPAGSRRCCRASRGRRATGCGRSGGAGRWPDRARTPDRGEGPPLGRHEVEPVVAVPDALAALEAGAALRDALLDRARARRAPDRACRCRTHVHLAVVLRPGVGCRSARRRRRSPASAAGRRRPGRPGSDGDEAVQARRRGVLGEVHDSRWPGRRPRPRASSARAR